MERQFEGLIGQTALYQDILNSPSKTNREVQSPRSNRLHSASSPTRPLQGSRGPVFPHRNAEALGSRPNPLNTSSTSEIPVPNPLSPLSVWTPRQVAVARPPTSTVNANTSQPLNIAGPHRVFPPPFMSTPPRKDLPMDVDPALHPITKQEATSKKKL
jgi:hypothetical protein